MKTNILLVALSAVLLSTSVARAQRVEAELLDGNPVINCEAMPTWSYDTKPKGNTQAELSTKEADAKLYKRFAVSRIDNNQPPTGPPTKAGESGQTGLLWSDSFGVCAKLGPLWRVPTRRENILIWILMRELEQCNGFIPFSNTDLINTYVSATILSARNKTFFVVRHNFLLGVLVDCYDFNVAWYYVRCIKEL